MGNDLFHHEASKGTKGHKEREGGLGLVQVILLCVLCLFVANYTPQKCTKISKIFSATAIAFARAYLEVCWKMTERCGDFGTS